MRRLEARPSMLTVVEEAEAIIAGADRCGRVDLVFVAFWAAFLPVSAALDVVVVALVLRLAGGGWL